MKTEPFDVADYLSEENAIQIFLEDARADGDPAALALALHTVALARARSESASQIRSTES